jgi:hypothetical protein
LRSYPQPAWTGKESLDGKILFIYPEQGLGDTIQFCRYAELAEARGAKVILSVQDPLVRLMRQLGPTIGIVGQDAAPPDFDYHVALMSLPWAFRTDWNTFPARIPYLRAEPERVGKWRRIIGNGGFKVGICWQGNRRGQVDAGRSFPVRQFECLAGLPGVRLISLQKNDGAGQLLDLPAGMTVETLGDDFDSGGDAFVDTAAAMENLDLVITSDTAIAHLAGALGRPTWIALKHVGDWRWFLDRSDSPWYPTVRLFRQSQRGDWAGVFSEIERQLAALTKQSQDLC